MRSIFVGGLHADTTSDDLSGYFEHYHPVSSVNLPLKKKTGKCKGFAFVDLLLDSSFDLAELLGQEHYILGKRVDVEETMCPEEKISRIMKLQANKIFIGRFSKREDLRRVVRKLSEYSEVWSCNFVNSRARRKVMLIQAELADPSACTLLARTGFLFNGIRYQVTLYKPKALWAIQDKESKFSLRTQNVSKQQPVSMERQGSQVLNSFLKCSGLNQHSSNYRFNISPVYQQYGTIRGSNSYTNVINNSYSNNSANISTINLNSMNQILEEPEMSSSKRNLVSLANHDSRWSKLFLLADDSLLKRAASRGPQTLPVQDFESCTDSSPIPIQPAQSSTLNNVFSQRMFR